MLQVIVTVDDYAVLCTSLSCDYEYIDDVASISAFSIDPSTNQMSVAGTNLGAPVSVEIVNVACENILVSEALDLVTGDLSG